jgi:hypothetical protein
MSCKKFSISLKRNGLLSGSHWKAEKLNEIEKSNKEHYH